MRLWGRYSEQPDHEFLHALRRLVWFGLFGCLVIAALDLAQPVEESIRWSLCLAVGMIVVSLWAIFAAARAHARGDSERAQVPLAERAARAEAEEAVRLRDEVLSVAAHELKNPATTLRGYAQLMARQLERTGALDLGTARHALRAIDSQSAKLDRLLGQVLDVSSMRAGKLDLVRASTDVSQLVTEAVSAAGLLHRETHTLVLRAQPGLTAVVDPVRFEQVVTNLLDNAIKYSPSGGEVEVELATDERRLRLAVRDHGIGISEEHRQRIFERFYQARATDALQGRGGVGLGLYVCHEIVRLHGGTLRAEAPPDGGTRVIAELPLHGPAAAQPVQAA